MSLDRVRIHCRGERACYVSRAKLAKNAQEGEVASNRLGSRPGEPVDKYFTFGRVSYDVYPATITILDTQNSDPLSKTPLS